MTRTCKGCGHTFVTPAGDTTGHGRARAYCPDCRPGSEPRTPDVVELMEKAHRGWTPDSAFEGLLDGE